MSAKHVSNWVKNHPLSPIHVDCATTVMLKILDGKCKMSAQEKVVMAQLYQQVKHLPGELFSDNIHQVIQIAKSDHSNTMKMFIYEKRLLAETQLSRQVMKTFKSMIREQGLFTQDSP